MILHHQNTSTFRNAVLENRLRQSMDTVINFIIKTIETKKLKSVN